MARAIDADELKETITDGITALSEHMGKYKLVFTAITHTVQNTIDKAPTIDPVKHGKWEHIKRHLWKTDNSGEIDIFALDYECDIGYYKCSECGNKTVHNTNYCPHCGARMDGE